MDFQTLSVAKAYADKVASQSGGSLIAGDLIEIKDGVVRSTLGDSAGFEMKSKIYYDSGRLILEDSYIYEEDVEDGKAWAEYVYMPIYQPTFLDKPENEEEPIDIEVKYYPPESDDFVILKGLYAYSYDSKEEVYEYVIYVNAKLGEDDVEIDNTDYPIFEINAEMPYWNGDKGEYEDIFGIYVGVSGYGVQDISGARFIIDKEVEVEKFVTLPQRALNLSFDEEPTPGSENLISSDTLYQLVNNLMTEIGTTFQYIQDSFEEELENIQDNLSYDNAPTENSTKLVQSDGIYKAIKAETANISSPLFIVDVLSVGSDSKGTFSHTFSQIAEAYEAGKIIYLRHKYSSTLTYIYQLAKYDSNSYRGGQNFNFYRIYSESSVEKGFEGDGMFAEVWVIGTGSGKRFTKEISFVEDQNKQKELFLTSSSGKKFKITINDSGEISATETT